MLRGRLADPDFKGQFSGHETFPLRHLWLRKAYDAVVAAGDDASRGLFTNHDAIVTFGVGRNMVLSIRHWALACEIIEERNGSYVPTALGDFLFGPGGRDPFMEQAATIWLVHWLIAGRPDRTTTWYWAFNQFTAQTFDREALAKPIAAFCKERQRARTSAATIKRDVECFIRSYVARSDSKFSDDTMEPVLAELGLIRPHSAKSFEFRRGPKPSLPDGVFNFALYDFWERHAPSIGTLAVETIAYEPGAPGRVFKLDEYSLIERLARIEESSGRRFLWIDSAGVRNVARGRGTIDPYELLATAYGSPARKAA